MSVHANMVSYYGGTTSAENPEEYLKKLKKQPKVIKMLSGKYINAV
ncbi:hypothetical protein J6P92_00060 [bacterium]|nr:hypothetical protein [bacterium]